MYDKIKKKLFFNNMYIIRNKYNNYIIKTFILLINNLLIDNRDIINMLTNKN